MACSYGQDSADQCKQLFEAILAKEFSNYRYGRVHRLTVDTFSLQHPDSYLASAISFAAHLTGVCCEMEYEDNADLLRRLQRWLSSRPKLEKPGVLVNLGQLTITHIVAAKDGPEHIKLVEAQLKPRGPTRMSHTKSP